VGRFSVAALGLIHHPGLADEPAVFLVLVVGYAASMRGITITITIKSTITRTSEGVAREGREASERG